MKKKIKATSGGIKSRLKTLFWFLAGIFLSLFFLLSFSYVAYEHRFKEKVYPGVKIANVEFSGKTKADVKAYFDLKNAQFERVKFTFWTNDISSTISAKDLKYGFNSDLLAEQAVTVGRGDNPISDLYIKAQGLLAGVELTPSYTFSGEALDKLLNPIAKKIDIEPVDALFNFTDGRVVAFRPSNDGQELDVISLKKELSSKFIEILGSSDKDQVVTIAIPIKTLKPKIQTTDSNNFGIKELIGIGSSKFAGSIPNRIHNIELAASRVNGILVGPGEIFSFNNALGDVSKFTGYKEAFIISGGKTILGDGGGVCQVSTTLFRAILNSGMPVAERHAHSYRVGYYEQDAPAGLDATVYSPSVDLKFKNDSGNYILIQSYTNTQDRTLTFFLYGANDGRKATVDKPVITNQIPAPPPLYTDDPSLPKGTVRQIDFAANGASVYFVRRVEKDGKIIISDKFVSNFRPWQAVYLRGTHE